MSSAKNPSVNESLPANGVAIKEETTIFQSPADTAVEEESAGTSHSWRFWAIIISLSLTGLLSAIEGTIITSALPTITKSLGGSNSYVWVPNAFFLGSTATLPLFAQASNVFGRRWLILLAVALFTLGSGLSGGSSSMGMLIGARTM
jgi:predicted MFS family arabinose efflux permease